MNFSFTFASKDNEQAFIDAVKALKLGTASKKGKAIIVKAKSEKSKKVLVSLAKDLKGKLNESRGYLKPITKINESYQTNTNQTLSFSSGEKVDITPLMASVIMETHDSLNETNQKVLREMVNKDKNSFLRVLDFSVKLERGS